MSKPKVIIIGSGFGGLHTCRSLKHADASVTLIDKTNHHLFQPLLYQVASAALAPSDVAAPIREVFKGYDNTSVLMNEVEEILKEKKQVRLATGELLDFDYLVIAVGAEQSYFGHDDWKEHTSGIKTLADALHLRRELLLAYEEAESSEMYEDTEDSLSFAIVGGGPTGVEMAGAFAEVAHRTLMKNFRKIDPNKTKIYLIEGHPHLLPPYPKELGERAQKDLEKMGVTVITGVHVTNITDDGVYIGDRLIKSQHVIWAAGNKAPALLKTLNVPLDRGGRVIVGKDLSIPDEPNIFVIGDAASAQDREGNPLPGIAPVAIQQGHYVAKLIRSQVAPEKRKPFQYFDKGTMAAIGKTKAVGMIGKWKLKGFFAWVIWSVVHIFYLVGFRSRALVMVQWFLWYVTGSRSSRLILEGMFEDTKKM